MALVPHISKKIMLALVIGLASLIPVGIVLLPHLDGPDSRLHSNEAMAFARLRIVNSRQEDYASPHATGFACELRLLRSEAPGDHSDDVREEFLVSGSQAGYRFEVVHCEADPNGRVVRYRIAAVPLSMRKSGFLVFCTDESGVLWYDRGGTIQSCFASQRIVR